MSKGTIEYEDAILAITDITLRDGAFLVTATAPGPLAAYRGPIRMYGPDGVLVQEGGYIDCPAADAHQHVTLEAVLTPESPVALP